MMTPTKEKYLELAKEHTEQELASLLSVGPRTIRRYAREFGIKPKINKYRNISLDDWALKFSKTFGDKIILTSPLSKAKDGHVIGTCKCCKCGLEWQTNVNEKIRSRTGCMACDRGHHGNLYSKAEIESMMNKNYENQWRLIKYGHYSKKDSVVKCNLCGREITVKLSDFILNTTLRCTNCQTGSFGEYVIATVLDFNGIPFKREKIIMVDDSQYRLDFLINEKLALEYSGAQHFEQGLYYSEKINDGVKIKEKWYREHGYEFAEQKASYDVDEIIRSLSEILKIDLERPTPEFFKKRNPDIVTVLSYMRTHSMRQTIKDLGVSSSKIKKYVCIDGYKSVSEWQADNKN